jgi:D-inositol-3-phosphate glycosyltransferase
VTPVTDLAVLGADPRFAGGALAQMEAFWRAAVELGREPSFDYLAHPSFAGAPVDGSPLNGPGLKAPFGRIDAANQLAAGIRLAPRLQAARSVWVVSTTAAHGYAALRSARPYACWIGTGLADEWAGRRPGLPASRRVAIRVNAPVLRWLERRVIRGARHVYATSPWSRGSVARAAGIDEDRVGLLPIPVDLESFFPAPDEEWRRTIARPVLAFVGRSDDTRKNVQLLLDSLPMLPEVRLLLVGAPPAGIVPERVEATGVVPSVAPYLRQATLFVLPSHQEGFGIAAAEALATGLPVITTPCGGPEALVTESGGGVVLSSFSPQELASTIRQLLADPDGLEALRRHGREHVVREHSPTRFRELLGKALARESET